MPKSVNVGNAWSNWLRNGSKHGSRGVNWWGRWGYKVWTLSPNYTSRHDLYPHVYDPGTKSRSKLSILSSTNKIFTLHPYFYVLSPFQNSDARNHKWILINVNPLLQNQSHLQSFVHAKLRRNTESQHKRIVEEKLTRFESDAVAKTCIDLSLCMLLLRLWCMPLLLLVNSSLLLFMLWIVREDWDEVLKSFWEFTE